MLDKRGIHLFAWCAIGLCCIVFDRAVKSNNMFDSFEQLIETNVFSSCNIYKFSNFSIVFSIH